MIGCYRGNLSAQERRERFNGAGMSTHRSYMTVANLGLILNKKVMRYDDSELGSVGREETSYYVFLGCINLPKTHEGPSRIRMTRCL